MFPSFFSLPYFLSTLHIVVFIIFLCFIYRVQSFFFSKIISILSLRKANKHYYHKPTRLILLPTCHYFFMIISNSLSKTPNMNDREHKLQYSNEQFTYSLWSVSLFFLFFFSSFLFFFVGLFWFSSFSKSVAFFLCSFPLSLYFFSFFLCLVRSVSFLLLFFSFFYQIQSSFSF